LKKEAPMKQARHIGLAATAIVLLFLGACQSTPPVDEGPKPVPVPGPFQKWADADGNDILDPRELDALADTALRLFTAPHEVRTPMDEPFDANRDGVMDDAELWCARKYFQEQLLYISQDDKDLARRVDFNNDGRVDMMESWYATEYLFIDPIAREPHEVSAPIDEKVERIKDRFIDSEEIFDYRLALVRSVSLSQAPPNIEELMMMRENEVYFPMEALAEAEREGEARPSEEPLEEPMMEEEQPAEEPVEDYTAEEEEAVVEEPAQEERPAATAEVKASVQDGVELAADIDAVFPVFHKYYDDHPIGTATLKNGTGSNMDKIKVQLIVKGYMTEKKTCKGPESLSAGQEGEVELYALFTKDVLDISEQTKALANISVSYSSGGQAKTVEFVETVKFLNRNNMTWDDDNRVAAFVTKNDKSVLMFRSAAVTIVDQASAAVDAKLRTAMAIHETLRLYGMKYWSDPKSSFATKSRSKVDVDSLQFPEETLQLKTGDCDDLSILYAALLEASSVSTAFITVPGHIFIAFELDMSAAEAKSSFLKPDDLIFIDDTAWIPLEVTSLKSDFLSAWETGAKEWREAKAKNQQSFLPFDDAAEKYAPVGFSATAVSLSLPSEKSLIDAYKTEVKKFVSQEIATQVAALSAEIKKNGGKAESVNKLGVLYARYGLMTEASAQFTAIVKTEEYVPALVNLGNIAYLEGNTKTALQYYERAQKKSPDKAVVLLGIARANHELENYGKVTEAYARLKTVDAKLASGYTYLDLRGTEATKAADIANVTDQVEWDTK
jgi:hypothetical protein